MTRAFSAAWRPRCRLARYVACLSLLMLWNASADARSLEAVIERGTLTLCASPNALPFASKNGPVRGFQIELGEKIAEQLGVKHVALSITHTKAQALAQVIFEA